MCAKFFYILIVLMAGLFPFKMQASETKQTFILYTPYTGTGGRKTVSGCKEEAGTFLQLQYRCHQQ